MNFRGLYAICQIFSASRLAAITQYSIFLEEPVEKLEKIKREEKDREKELMVEIRILKIRRDK